MTNDHPIDQWLDKTFPIDESSGWARVQTPGGKPLSELNETEIEAFIASMPRPDRRADRTQAAMTTTERSKTMTTININDLSDDVRELLHQGLPRLQDWTPELLERTKVIDANGRPMPLADAKLADLERFLALIDAEKARLERERDETRLELLRIAEPEGNA